MFRAVFIAALYLLQSKVQVAGLDDLNLWPINRLLVLPHIFSTYKAGTILIMPWIFLCERTSRSVITAVLPYVSDF